MEGGWRHFLARPSHPCVCAACRCGCRYCDVVFVFIWDAAFFFVTPGWNSYVGALFVIIAAIGIVMNKTRKEKLGIKQAPPLINFGDCACCCRKQASDDGGGEISHDDKSAAAIAAAKNKKAAAAAAATNSKSSSSSSSSSAAGAGGGGGGGGAARTKNPVTVAKYATDSVAVDTRKVPAKPSSSRRKAAAADSDFGEDESTV
jgi:hypothetical protein